MEPKLNCRKDTELEELNQAGPRLRPVIGTIWVSFIGAPLAQEEREQEQSERHNLCEEVQCCIAWELDVECG